MSTPRPLGTVITFYSYKGGVGRTLALANVAALLATWGRRVLCIDWDLEAPGLHQYFKEYLAGETLRAEPGLVELVEAWSRGEEPDWRAHVRRLDLPRGREPLSLLPAGRLDDSYVARMQKLDWDALYERQQFGTTLERWREEWKEAYDFILVDSRTGVTDIGGICTIQLPDQLVLCVTANEQSLQGAKDVAERAAKQRQRLPFDRGGVPCVPVPTRFEGRVESALAKQWLERFATDLEPLYRQWIAATITPRQLLDLVKIPSVPVWSFGEGLPVLTEGTTDPESIGFAFETLAALLMRGLGETELLVTRRDDYVGARRQATAAATDRNRVVVLPIGRRDSMKVAQSIVGALQERGVSAWSVDRLKPGDPLVPGIDSAITQAHMLIFVLEQPTTEDSRRFMESLLDHVLSAVGNSGATRRVVPVLLEPLSSEDLPVRLRLYRAVELTGNSSEDAAAIDQIAEAVRRF